MSYAAAVLTEHTPRTTEAVGFLLMAEEKGLSAARLSSVLCIDPKRIPGLLQAGREGRLPRVMAVGGAGTLGQKLAQPSAFGIGSRPAKAASRLVLAGELSYRELLLLGRESGISAPGMRSRLLVGFEKADITLEQLPDGGVRLPAEMIPVARLFEADGWRPSEGEDE